MCRRYESADKCIVKTCFFETWKHIGACTSFFYQQLSC